MRVVATYEAIHDLSGSHPLALSQRYSEMIEPVPDSVALAAARSGQAPAPMDALFEATKHEQPITDWTPFDGRPKSAKPAHCSLGNLGAKSFWLLSLHGCRS